MQCLPNCLAGVAIGEHSCSTNAAQRGGATHAHGCCLPAFWHLLLRIDRRSKCRSCCTAAPPSSRPGWMGMMPVCLFPNISREWLQGRNLTTVSLFFALERASCGGCCQHEGVRSRYALDTAGLNTQCTD